MLNKKALNGLALAIALLLLGTSATAAPSSTPRGFFCDTVTEIPQAECEALVALYNSTDGANWNHNNGWLDTSTPCSWYGVKCQGGHVTQIVVRGNNLDGTIPSEIDGLIELQVLDLWANCLTGNIPPELGNLTGLRKFKAYGNGLSGNIAPELGNLSNLQYLVLSLNHLSGNIPPELGNLTNLQELHLHSNGLSGSIPPELGNLVNMQKLHLSLNHFSGSIPPELGNLTNLQYLLLYYNQLTGNIPPELGNLTNLQTLELGHNQLSGTIPSELGNLTNLQELRLNSNQLSGALPRTLPNLTKLSLFWFHDTDLCEPADAAFQTWLASIIDLRSTGVICPTPPPSCSVSIIAPPQVFAGTIFTAKVNISQVTNFDACDYEVVFDPGALTLLEIRRGEIDGTAIPIIAANQTSPGRVKIVEGVAGTPGVTGSGCLAELRFRHKFAWALDSGRGTTDISDPEISAVLVLVLEIGLENGTLADNEANKIPATWKGAHIDVIYWSWPPWPPGDCNGDGVVNALDITCVELIVAGIHEPTFAADVNGDGRINALDITKTELLVATAHD